MLGELRGHEERQRPLDHELAARVHPGDLATASQVRPGPLPALSLEPNGSQSADNRSGLISANKQDFGPTVICIA